MFLFSHWLSLNITTRHKIAAQFGIIKRGSTEVFNDTIKSDGYLVKEIEQALNIDALQKFIGTQETDMQKLWTWMVDKIEGRELTGINLDTTLDDEVEVITYFDKKEQKVFLGNEDITDKVKPKRGRPTKK